MKLKFISACIAGAVTLAVLPGAASADVVGSGGGDRNLVPLYTSLSFGTVNFGNDGGAINGIQYDSNFVPLPLASGSTTINANGATLVTQAASAYAGWYAGRNYASISVTNANANDLYYQVSGQGSATSVEFFTLDAAAAYARFTWQVTGTTFNPSNIQPACTIDYTTCFPTATGRLDFGATTNTNATWVNLFDDPTDLLDSITRFGPGTYTYDLPIVLNTQINLFYWSSAYTQVNAGDVAAGSNFTLTANYYNTVFLGDVQLLNASLEVIDSDWSMTDRIGFDTLLFNQDGRQVPLEDAPELPPEGGTVPEPATLALLGLGLAGLGFARRKR